MEKLTEILGELWEEEEIENFGNYILLRAAEDFHMFVIIIFYKTHYIFYMNHYYFY